MTSWTQGDWLRQHPAVAGVDLPGLRMAPMRCHPSEHGVLLDTCDDSYYSRTTMLERLYQNCSPQEKAAEAQHSNKKDDGQFHYLEPPLRGYSIGISLKAKSDLEASLTGIVLNSYQHQHQLGHSGAQEEA